MTVERLYSNGVRALIQIRKAPGKRRPWAVKIHWYGLYPARGWSLRRFRSFWSALRHFVRHVTAWRYTGCGRGAARTKRHQPHSPRRKRV